MKRLPIFPDVNVWLSLMVKGHQQGERAREWYASLSRGSLVFCRMTHLGILRLLTLKAVMGEAALTNIGALQLVTQWIDHHAAELMAEPVSVSARFPEFAARDEISPKLWTDAYLTAFAMEAGLTLVTFDQALAKRTPHSILL